MNSFKSPSSTPWVSAVLYPVLGCSKEDITDSDIKEFLEYILDPIFISTDEDGELCVSP